MKKTSLRFRISALVLIATILPLGVFYFFGLQDFFARMEGILASELNAKAELAAKDIDRFITERIVDTKIIASAHDLSHSERTETNNYLAGIAKKNPWASGVYLLNIEGTIVAGSSANPIEDKSVWDEYSELNTILTKHQNTMEGVFVVEAEELGNGAGPGILFLTAIKDSSKRISSFLLVELAFKDMQSIILDLRNTIESNRHIYLVKNDGTVMLTDDPYTKPFQMFPDINRHPDMLEFFSVPGAKGHFRYIDHSGNQNTAAYADLSEFGSNQGLDWSIVAIASEDEFFESINESKNNLIILWLLLSFLMTGLAHYLSLKTTRPLLNTIKAAEKLKSGCASQRIPTEGSRETILLAENFNQMAQQIEKREQDLRESNALKSEFIATASHELRTPLTAVIGYAELLVNNDAFSLDERKTFLHEIYDKSIALDRIVDELLDVSRIESGRALHLTSSLTRVAETVKQIVAQRQKENPTRTFELTIDNEGLVLDVDKGKLIQVLENLIGNAVKFSPEGSSIRIDVRKLNGDYKFSISDKGIGIPYEQQEYVFDKFFRADTSHTAIHGLGIGLYLTKNIIELHGGQTWLESIPGEGSTFFFTLPHSAP